MEDRLRKFLKDTIFMRDIKCICCGRELNKESKYCICDDCFSGLPFITEKVCKHCGEPIQSLAEYCMQCKNHVDRNFDKARAVFLYKDKIRTLIMNYKFFGSRYLGEYLSWFLYDLFIQENWNCDLVIPAPISKRGKKERSFNQTELLCHSFIQKGFEFNSTCLVKYRETKHQVGLGYKERQTNLVDAFKVVDKSAVKGKKILLVDDIYTTGATASEIAKTLKSVGASEVFVATLCHEKPDERKN